MTLQVIAGLFVVCCFFQCYFCWKAWRFANWQRKSIETFNTNDKQRRSDNSSSWLIWVDEAFPEGNPSSVGWSREDAFEMLDEAVSRDQYYQWLQRTAVMAPLVGVLITAFGLNGLEINPGTALTLSSILAVVTPLFRGVIVGAFLALINQVLLQVVQREIETLRTSAQRWFDRSVWARAVAAPREAVAATIAALVELSGAIQETTRGMKENSQELSKASRSVARAGVGANQAFEEFAGNMAEFSDQVKTLQKVIESTRVLAESMGPSLRQANGVLTTTVKAFQEAVVGEFVPAARDHRTTATVSTETAQKTLAILGGIEATARNLQVQGGHLIATTKSLDVSADALKNSISSNLLPAEISLQDAARTLGAAAQAFPSQVEGLHAAFAASADHLRVILKDDLAPAATQLHETIKDDLLPMSFQHRIVIKDISEVSNGLKSLFGQIEISSSSLEERYQRLAEAAGKQSQASEEIYESVKERLIPAQQSLGESAADLAESTKSLSRFLREGIDPATLRLAELGQIIIPMREAAAAIGTLGNINGELRDLTEILLRLREALDSARVLADLEQTLGHLTESFRKADDLKQTISEMPDRFGKQLNTMSKEALRQQADDLKEILGDIAKQFHYFSTVDNGRAGLDR